MWAAFSLAVLYLAVLAAGVYEDGMNLFQFMAVFPDAMNKPFTLRWTPYTAKFILGALLLCGGVIALYYSSRMNRRPGEEHGSAKWGSVQELNKKYSDKDPARIRDPHQAPVHEPQRTAAHEKPASDRGRRQRRGKDPFRGQTESAFGKREFYLHRSEG